MFRLATRLTDFFSTHQAVEVWIDGFIPKVRNSLSIQDPGLDLTRDTDSSLHHSTRSYPIGDFLHQLIVMTMFQTEYNPSELHTTSFGWDGDLDGSHSYSPRI